MKIKTLLDIMKVFRVFNLVEDIGCLGKSLNTTKSIFPETEDSIIPAQLCCIASYSNLLNVAWLLVKPLALSESFDC